MRGIVFDGKLQIRDDIALKGMGERQVKVRIHRAGLCHSDVSVINGTIPFPTPVVLGHEGAGVVEEVGSAVTKVKPGDHVVVTTVGHCGQCAACDSGRPTHCRDTFGIPRIGFTVGGEDAYQFANAGVFTDSIVVQEAQAVVIDQRVPLESACLIGCAIVTGTGAVLNRAKVRPGESVVVIGAGGIGQAVIQGARLSSAGRIIVIDANPRKEETARRFGATDFIDASTVKDTTAAVRDLGFGNGVDYTFECVGHPALIRQAIDLLDWGGTCVMLGVPGMGSEVSYVVSNMYNDKTIMGCRYGTTRPHYDIPMIVQFYLDGRYFLDEMVTKTYDLADVETALHDLEAGDLNRGVLTLT